VLPILLLLLASAPASNARADAPKKEARVIALDETQARVFHTVVTNPSIPAVIEFPEPWVGTPSCGDCVDLSGPQEVLKNSDALFGVQLFPDQQYILIKPAQFSRKDGGRVPDADFLTTLTVKLQSKLTVTIRIQYGSIEQADARVVFTLPNRDKETAFVREQIAKAKTELEAQQAEMVAHGVRDEFLRAFLQPHECVNASRRERNDDIVVAVQELCQFGRRVVVHFTVENRGTAPFNLGDIEVLQGSGNQTAPEENVAFRLDSDDQQIPWNMKRAGVLTFEQPDDSGHPFTLNVHENGGRARVVNLAAVSF
jgi:hypothetical protein